jgi:hypothetical protein
MKTRWHTGAAALILLAMSVSGCSGQRQVIHETATVTAVRMSPATVTVSRTVIQTMPAASATQSPSSTAAPPPTVPKGGASKTDVLLHAGRVVQDVQTADQRLASGFDAGLSTTMSFLATDFADLQSDGPPPGADVTKYLASCSALSSFAQQASAEFTAGDDMDATARYTVLRQHVNDVLRPVDAAYGSHLSI